MIKRLIASIAIFLLSAQASALVVSFSFEEDGLQDFVGTPVPGTVTGLISGLQDNMANQLAGVVVEILSFPAALSGSIDNGLIATDWAIVLGDGFSVFDGILTDADFAAQEGDGNSDFDQLRLNFDGFNRLSFTGDVDETTNSGGFAGATYTTITQVNPVPTPATLALLGLGLAGLGWSKRKKA